MAQPIPTNPNRHEFKCNVVFPNPAPVRRHDPRQDPVPWREDPYIYWLCVIWAELILIALFLPLTILTIAWLYDAPESLGYLFLVGFPVLFTSLSFYVITRVNRFFRR